jgi:DNA repair exonuclease SbcCD nuclease subunit
MEISKVCKLYLLLGNHDMASADGSVHSLTQFEPIATILDKPTTFEIEGVPIIAHPYTKNMDSLNSYIRTAPPGAIALLHQGVMGTPQGSSWISDESVDYTQMPDAIDTAYVGHYHSPFETDHLIIPGSIGQHTWSDSGTLHGYRYHEVDGAVSTEFVELGGPRFWRMRYTEETRNLLTAGHTKLVSYNFIRLTHCPNDLDCQAVKEELCAAGAEAVEFIFDADVGVLTPRSGVVSTGDFSIEPLLKEYEELQMPSRRAEIGKLIRDFQYEVPK